MIDTSVLVTKGLNAVVMIMYGLAGIIFAGFIGVLVFFLKKTLMFKDIVIVWVKDIKGNLYIDDIDRGCKFRDRKTKNMMYHLKKRKDQISPDVMENNHILSAKGKRVFNLFRSGERQYSTLQPDIDTTKLKFEVSENDVDWASNSYERLIKVTGGDDKIALYLAFGIVAFAFVVVIIISIYLIQAFPEVAKSLSSAAESLKQARGGAIVQP